MPGNAASLSRSAVQWQIYLTADEGQSQVLGCILADWPSEVVRRTLRRRRVSPLLGVLFISGLFLLITCTIAWSGGRLTRLLFARLAVIASLSGLCVLLVKVSYSVLLPSVAAIAAEATRTPDAHVGMLEWFKMTLSLTRQLKWSLVAGSTSALGLIVIDTLGPRGHPEAETLLSLFVLFFLGGHAAYWGFTMPTYIKAISQYRLTLFALNPSQSWVVSRIWELVRYALLVGGGLVLVFIVASYLVFIQILPTLPATVLMVCWYALAVAAALFLFFYSRGCLSVIVTNEKRHTLAELLQTIDSLRYQISLGRIEEIELLKKTLELYEQVEATPGAPVAGGALRALITSILLPGLPVLTAGLDVWVRLHGSR